MESGPHHFDTVLRIILVTLTSLLAILCAMLFVEYQHLRELGTSPMHLHSRALPVTNADFIQSWMTYDYIDHIYALPPGYVKAALSIADSRYPRVSIAQSAEAQHKSAAAMTTAVQNAVQNYLLTQGQPAQ